MFHNDIQYALNLAPENQSLSSRTVERYKKLIVEDELAGQIMETITATLIQKLDLSVAKQRLDSTHVFSDMAQFGRTRMMGVTIKRFLTQVKRHDETPRRNATTKRPTAACPRNFAYATSPRAIFCSVLRRKTPKVGVACENKWLRTCGP